MGPCQSIKNDKSYSSKSYQSDKNSEKHSSYSSPIKLLKKNNGNNNEENITNNIKINNQFSQNNKNSNINNLINKQPNNNDFSEINFPTKTIKEKENEENKNRNDALYSHNEYRKKHKSNPLTLNDELCEIAQNYSDNLAKTKIFKQSGNKFHGKPLGENIFKCSEKKDIGKIATESWYNEKKNYDYKQPGFKIGIGNFTQIIWKNTKEVGFGFSYDDEGISYVVANYFPAGNIDSPVFFKENVSACESDKNESDKVNNNSSNQISNINSIFFDKNNLSDEIINNYEENDDNNENNGNNNENNESNKENNENIGNKKNNEDIKKNKEDNGNNDNNIEDNGNNYNNNENNGNNDNNNENKENQENNNNENKENHENNNNENNGNNGNKNENNNN